MDYFALLKKYLKFILPAFFALAIAFGLLQRENPSYQPKKTREAKNSQTELWSFYNKGRQLAGDLRGQEPAKTTATFLAVGDIMLSRKVAQKIKENNDPSLPFRPFAPLFESVDFSFGNLESPLGNTIGGHSMIFGAPPKNIEPMVSNNFRVLNLANNHAMDQSLAGLQYTKKYLSILGIQTTGTGDSLDEAWQPAVIAQNGIKLCFVGASYASINDGGKGKNEYVARIEDVGNLKLGIENSKSLCDFIVATMHAGTEYTTKPNQAQIDFAHAAIDYGADMVIGHHPHWVQTIERYCPHSATALNFPSPTHGEGAGGEVCSNPKYIFYSLGNFIFDQEWSQETKEGLTLKVEISKVCHPGLDPGSRNPGLDSGSQMHSTGMICGDSLQGSKTQAQLESIELIPIIIENYSTPRVADEAEAKKIFARIGQIEKILK